MNINKHKWIFLPSSCSRQTTFEEWTTKNILQPLGMTRSGFGTPNVANMAPVPMFPIDFGWLGPAGDMYSTLEDLTKLGKLFTQPGKQSIFKVLPLIVIETVSGIFHVFVALLLRSIL